jgi:hypothetical protein
MYKLQILRRAMKDLAQLTDNYPRLVAEQINQLADNPRPPGTKKLTYAPPLLLSRIPVKNNCNSPYKYTP